MSENEELAPQPVEFTNQKELNLAVNSAVEDIKRVETDPTARAGRAAGELGFFAALGDIAKSHMKDTAGVAFKDAKVGIMSVVGLVPFAKELSASSKAMREANKAAYYAGKAEKVMAKATDMSKRLPAYEAAVGFRKAEEALLDQAVYAVPVGSEASKRLAKALGERYPVREALHAAQHGLPPQGMVEKGWHGIKHIARTEIPKLIDPFPNVPEPLKRVAGVFDMVSFGSALVALLPPAAPVAAPVAAVSGMIGVGVPAAWQYIHNRIEFMKVGLKTQEKMVTLVKGEVKKKLGFAKSPDAQRAAQSFV